MAQLRHIPQDGHGADDLALVIPVRGAVNLDDAVAHRTRGELFCRDPAARRRILQHGRQAIALDRLAGGPAQRPGGIGAQQVCGSAVEEHQRAVAVGGHHGVRHAAHDRFEFLALCCDFGDGLLQTVGHPVERPSQALQLRRFVHGSTAGEIAGGDALRGVAQFLQWTGDPPRQTHPNDKRRHQPEQARGPQRRRHAPQLAPHPRFRRRDLHHARDSVVGSQDRRGGEDAGFAGGRVKSHGLAFFTSKGLLEFGRGGRIRTGGAARGIDERDDGFLAPLQRLRHRLQLRQVPLARILPHHQRDHFCLSSDHVGIGAHIRPVQGLSDVRRDDDQHQHHQQQVG